MPAVGDLLRERIDTIARGVAAAAGARAEVEMLPNAFPPLVNTPAECALAARVAASLVGSERARELGAEWVDLDTIFSRSDYITLHLPENEHTRGLVSTRLLGLMKPGAVLVNCARAGVVDEAALRAARAQKSLRFLNDVYAKDEPGPKTCADIADIMLPHLGASTHEANANAARQAAEQAHQLPQGSLRKATVVLISRLLLPRFLRPELSSGVNRVQL